MTDTLVFIPEDKLIIYNNEVFISDKFIPSSSPEGTIRAIHWTPTDKHVEFEFTYRELIDTDIPVYVMPYVLLATEEKARLAKEAADAANNPVICSENIRRERDHLLAKTDYLMMSDYPITDANKQVLENYRQALRDITKDPSFPWTGTPVENIPWPKNPLAK